MEIIIILIFDFQIIKYISHKIWYTTIRGLKPQHLIHNT